jgi:hypothetical protein
MNLETLAGVFIAIIIGLFLKAITSLKIDHIADDYFINMANEGWAHAKRAEERCSELLAYQRYLSYRYDSARNKCIKLHAECKNNYQRERELFYKLQIAVNRWAKATHHIEQLVHAQKGSTGTVYYRYYSEGENMASGKLLATYRKECELIESHLVDRFNDVEVTESRSHYSTGINFLSISFIVFGYPSLVSFTRSANEGYMVSINYRGIIVYSERTPDKSYFVQACENMMLEFITKFDLKFGRK